MIGWSQPQSKIHCVKEQIFTKERKYVTNCFVPKLSVSSIALWIKLSYNFSCQYTAFTAWQCLMSSYFHLRESMIYRMCREIFYQLGIKDHIPILICTSPGWKPLLPSTIVHQELSSYHLYVSQPHSILTQFPKTKCHCKWNSGKQGSCSLQLILQGEINPEIPCCVNIKEHQVQGKIYTASSWNPQLPHMKKYESK